MELNTTFTMSSCTRSGFSEINGVSEREVRKADAVTEQLMEKDDLGLGKSVGRANWKS